MNQPKVQTYINVMESLVSDEVEKQIKRLPPNVRQYLDPIEITTYALNRIPPLYASSEQGRKKQEARAKDKFSEEITQAVRQGIAAVQRDPLRVSTPILADADLEKQKAEKALVDLREFLRREQLMSQQELSWDNLVTSVKYAIAVSHDVKQQRGLRAELHISSYDRQTKDTTWRK